MKSLSSFKFFSCSCFTYLFRRNLAGLFYLYPKLNNQKKENIGKAWRWKCRRRKHRAEELSRSKYESVDDFFAVMSDVQKIFLHLNDWMDLFWRKKFCTWDKRNSTMRSGLLINLIKCLRGHKRAPQPDISPFMIISECMTLPRF